MGPSVLDTSYKKHPCIRHPDGDTWDSLGRAKREFVLGCGRPLLSFRCPECGFQHLVPRHCRDRWCPDCLTRDVRAYIRTRAHRISFFEWPAHLVVAPRNVGLGHLAARIDQLTTGLYRLKRRAYWKRHVSRAIVAWGLTGSPTRGWHPHQHFIVDARWLSSRKLAREIQVAYRLDRAPFLRVRRAYDILGLYRELRKGTVGDARRLWGLPAAMIGEAEDAFYSRKRWWYIGDPPPAAMTPGLQAHERLSQSHARCRVCDTPAGRRWSIHHIDPSQWSRLRNDPTFKSQTLAFASGYELRARYAAARARRPGDMPHPRQGALDWSPPADGFPRS